MEDSGLIDWKNYKEILENWVKYS